LSQTARTALARNSDGRLEIFTVGTDGVAYHMYQTAANGGWSSWSSLGGSGETDAQPVARADQNGALEVLLVGTTGNVYHNYQTGGGWSGWLSIGGAFTENIRPVLGRNQDGRLELFLTGQGTDMLRAAETSANSSRGPPGQALAEAGIKAAFPRRFRTPKSGRGQIERCNRTLEHSAISAKYEHRSIETISFCQPRSDTSFSLGRRWPEAG